MMLEVFTRYGTILSYLSGARTRVGFYRYHQEGLYIGNFLSHKVHYNPHIHIAHAFLSLVHALEAPHGQVPLTKNQPRKPRPHAPGLPLQCRRFTPRYGTLARTDMPRWILRNNS